MDQPVNNPQFQEAMQFAMSPAGKKLMELLQQTNAQALQSALEKASHGEYADAREAINAFLATPDAQKLLNQLRDKP